MMMMMRDGVDRNRLRPRVTEASISRRFSR
jgi:hypothetical protein